MTRTSGDTPRRKSAVLAAYQRHRGALLQFVARMLSGRRDDVEDVLQEAFLLAYKAENGKEIEQPKSFLFQIARNVALNRLRQERRRPTDYLEDSDAADVLVSEWTREYEAIAQQKLEIHCVAIAALPPQCRKVYLMRKVYSMRYKEIAEALDITVSTVESHLEKAFARCHAYVDERLGEGAVRFNHPRTKQRV